MTYLSGLETYKPPLTRGGIPGMTLATVRRRLPVLRRPAPRPFAFSMFAPKRPVILPVDIYGGAGLSGLFSFVGKAAKKIGKVAGGVAKGVLKSVPGGKEAYGVAKGLVSKKKKKAKKKPPVLFSAIPPILQGAGPRPRPRPRPMVPGASEPMGGGGGGGVSYGGGGDDTGGVVQEAGVSGGMLGGISPVVLIGGAAALLLVMSRSGRR